MSLGFLASSPLLAGTFGAAPPYGKIMAHAGDVTGDMAVSGPYLGLGIAF